MWLPKVVQSPGCDHGHDEESRNGRDVKIDILDDYIRTPEVKSEAAVLGRQHVSPTPWLTERHGYDPTIVVQYINLYVSTISRLLVMSVITSGTSNNLRYIKTQ